MHDYVKYFLTWQLCRDKTSNMYEILKRGKFHNLSISCQLDLFDKMVKPILLYGCELWGLSN